MSVILALWAAACAPQPEEETPANGTTGPSGNSNTGPTAAAGLPQLVQGSPTEVEGFASTPFAGQRNGRAGVYTTTYTADNTLRLAFADLTRGTAESVTELPGTDRSYADGVQLKNGSIALAYQSSDYSGFGQNGTAQGWTLVGQDGSLLDMSFAEDGLTRPEGFAEVDDTLYGVFSQGSVDLTDAGLAHPVISYSQAPALGALSTSDLGSAAEVGELTGAALNGSSIAAVASEDGMLLAVGSPGGNVLLEGAAGAIALVDPVSREVVDRIAVPYGQGVELDVSGSRILSSGTTYDGTSLSIIDVDTGETQDINLYDLGLPLSGSQDYGDVFVVDAVFGPNGSIIATVNDVDASKVFVIDPETGDYDPVDEINVAEQSGYPSTFALVDSAYCLVVSGTRAATEAEVKDGATPGTIYSEVVCYAE